MASSSGPVETIDHETRVMALAGVGARVINAGLVFLTQVLFARMLGAAEFGIYSTANTIMLLLAGFATLGLVAMPQRFWPVYEADNDAARLRGLMRFASWAPFAAGSGFALAGCGVAHLASGFLPPAAVTATCIAMLTLPALVSLDVVEGIALAKAWKLLAYGVAFVVRPLVVPLVFIAAWLSGVTLDSALAVTALVAATWLSSLLLLVLVRRKVSTIVPAGPVIEERHRWIMTGLPVMLIDGAFMLMTSTDIILLSVFQSNEAVGAYSAAARLVALVAFVHHGLTWASGHHFSALHASGDTDALAAYAARTTRWTFLPSVAAATVMAFAAPLLGLLARAAVGPAEQLLVMTDNQNACAYAYAWAFVVNLGFCAALVPEYGAIGAAISTAFAYFAASLIVAREVKQRLGFDMHIVPLTLRAPKALAHV
jgi:O-antigen/teichoic acid export membrane protein